MNERIKELAEHSGFLYHVSVGLVAGPEASPHKFAELIVRECARQVRNTDLEDVEGGDGAVLRAAGEQIKKHFGVEE